METLVKIPEFFNKLGQGGTLILKPTINNNEIVDVLIDYINDYSQMQYNELLHVSLISQFNNIEQKQFIEFFNHVFKSKESVINAEYNISFYDDKFIFTYYCLNKSINEIEIRNINLISIVNNAEIGIIARDIDGKITQWNQGVEKIFGYTRDEVVGTNGPLLDFTKEDFDLYAQHISDVYAKQTIHSGEFRKKKKNGDEVYVFAKYMPSLDDNNNTIGTVSTYQDITKTYQERSFVDGLATIVKVASTGIMLKNIDGITVYANDAACDILGFSQEELRGKSSVLYETEKLKNDYSIIRERLLNGERVDNFSTTCRHKDGRVIDVAVSYSPVADSNGSITHLACIFSDVTELNAKNRRAMEMAVIVNQTDAAIVIKDKHGVVTSVNPAMINMTNYSSEELIGFDYRVYSLQSETEIKAILNERIMNNEVIRNVKSHIKCKDGTVIPVSINYSPLSENDEIIGSIAIITDITEIVEAEELLRRSQNDLMMLFNTMTSGFLSYRVVRDEAGQAIDFKIEVVNPAFEEIEGIEKNTTNGHLWSEKFPNQSDFFDILLDVAENGTELNFNRKIDATNRFVDVYMYSPERDVVACFENDVTERHLTAEQLQLSYNETTRLIQKMPAPVAIFDADGIILEANDAYAKTFAVVDPLTLIGRDSAEFKPQMSGHIITAANFQTMADNGVNYMEAIKDNGEIVYLRTVMQKIVYRGKSVFVAHCQDVSMERKTEQSLQEAVKSAREASETKSNFLANMSHEIRTPLNGVLGFTQLALQDNNLSLEVKDYLQKIENSADGLLVIINDILDISKIESGKMEIEEIPFTIHDVFTSCQLIGEKRAKEKGIRLLMKEAVLPNKVLVGDLAKLKQVLLNLLTNAIKFTNDGAVTYSAEVVKIVDNIATINFEVKDSGIGIDQDDLEKVFEPFMQADASTTRRFGGTGLGLSITKSLIELMGGKLKVVSYLGIGSKFSFVLDFEIRDADLYKENKMSSLSRKPIFNADVLICEDNEVNQQVIRENLNRVGIKTTIVENGKLGIAEFSRRQLEHEPFDLILMDIHMPVMDGLEATRILLDSGCKTPIVAMTANIMKSDIELYLKSGMVDCLGKPYTNSQLLEFLTKFLEPVSYQEVVHNDTKDVDSSYSPFINEKIGIDCCAGDKELYNKIKLNFYKSNIDFSKRLESYLLDSKIEDAHRLVHTLKGTSATIGATMLNSAVLLVETKLRKIKDSNEDDMSELSTSESLQQLCDMNKQLASVLKEIEPLVKKHMNDEQNTVKEEFDLDFALYVATEVEELLLDDDIDVLNLISRMKKAFTIDEDLTNTLIEQIENYDFEIAYETLKVIKEKLR